MRFAFVVHPIASGTESFAKLDDEGGLLRRVWGTDPLGLTRAMHEAVERAKRKPESAAGRSPSRRRAERNGLASRARRRKGVFMKSRWM